MLDDLYVFYINSINTMLITFGNRPWEKESFEVMVMYLTHGLSGEQGYQVSHQQSSRAAQVRP